jgi:hypothetical protein
VGLTNEVEVLKARRHIAAGCRPILSNSRGPMHGFPVPELSPWRWCPDHPDAHHVDHADSDNEAHRKAVPLLVSSTGFPIASGPALHGLIRAGHRDTEGSWRGAGDLIIGAKGAPLGSNSGFLSPVRPLSMSPWSIATVGRLEGGGGSIGLML